MQSILHRAALASAVIMIAVFASSRALAETQTVKVPFSFTVAGETFPAGDYSISHADFADFVTLAPIGSSRSFSTVVGPGSPGPEERKIALNFGEVGQTHVLQSIQYGAKITRKLNK
jgi:hypothetical protein